MKNPNQIRLTDGMAVATRELACRSHEPVGMVQVNDYHAVPEDMLLPPQLVQSFSLHHSSQLGYRIPAVHRAAAFALANQHLTLTGFGALALYGLEFFANACDTVLVGPQTTDPSKPGPLQPQISRSLLANEDIWHVWCKGVKIPIASPAAAVVHALKVLRKGTNGWQVLDCGGYHPSFVRAVQLVDAVRRHLSIDPIDILSASRHHLNLHWLVDVLVNSSALADSPKETEMRLIARKIADKHGLILQEQVPVKDGDRWITRFDLALIDPASGRKFGLMYDGAQHWDRERRQKDARINLEVTLEDWISIRIASNTLATMYQQLDTYFSRVLVGG